MTKEEIMQAYPPAPECPLTEEEIRRMRECWWMIEPTPGDRLLAGFSEEASAEATALAEAYLDWQEQVEAWREGHPDTQAREIVVWTTNAADDAKTGERSVREALDLVEYTIKLNPFGMAVMSEDDRRYVNTVKADLAAKLTAYAA